MFKYQILKKRHGDSESTHCEMLHTEYNKNLKKCLFYNGEGGKRRVIKTDIEDGKMKFEQ